MAAAVFFGFGAGAALPAVALEAAAGALAFFAVFGFLAAVTLLGEEEAV